MISNAQKWSFGLPDSENLPKVKIHVIDLSNKNGRHSLVEGGAIHVDGGAHRKDKTCHSFVHMVVLLKTAESDWQGSRTRRQWDKQARLQAKFCFMEKQKNKSVRKNWCLGVELHWN